MRLERGRDEGDPAVERPPADVQRVVDHVDPVLEPPPGETPDDAPREDDRAGPSTAAGRGPR